MHGLSDISTRLCTNGCCYCKARGGYFKEFYFVIICILIEVFLPKIYNSTRNIGFSGTTVARLFSTYSEWGKLPLLAKRGS